MVRIVALRCSRCACAALDVLSSMLRTQSREVGRADRSQLLENMLIRLATSCLRHTHRSYER